MAVGRAALHGKNGVREEGVERKIRNIRHEQTSQRWGTKGMSLGLCIQGGGDWSDAGRGITNLENQKGGSSSFINAWTVGGRGQEHLSDRGAVSVELTLVWKKKCALLPRTKKSNQLYQPWGKENGPKQDQGRT